MVRVSIIIKTLNEETNIRRAIESSLAAVKPFQGEVVVADSGSQDKTIEIAKQYPVTLVQLRNPAERCCGVGPQLGYQHTLGEFIYILDGDMELKAPFLRRAMDFLDSEPNVAGVGGFINEMRVDNLEVEGRIKRFKRLKLKQVQPIECLNGGGLYRRAAIEDVGYISDRNLHAFEEYDLGARLRARGWQLVSLQDTAVDHYSYALGTWRLFFHRIRSGRFLSAGELLRSAIGGRYLSGVTREIRLIQLAAGVWAYWALALAASWRIGGNPSRIFLLLAVAAPIIGMAIRQRSLSLGIYSIVSWHFNAVGSIVGFVRSRRPPMEPIDCVVLRLAPSAEESAPLLTAIDVARL